MSKQNYQSTFCLLRCSHCLPCPPCFSFPPLPLKHCCGNYGNMVKSSFIKWRLTKTSLWPILCLALVTALVQSLSLKLVKVYTQSNNSLTRSSCHGVEKKMITGPICHIQIKAWSLQCLDWLSWVSIANARWVSKRRIERLLSGDMLHDDVTFIRESSWSRARFCLFYFDF